MATPFEFLNSTHIEIFYPFPSRPCLFVCFSGRVAAHQPLLNLFSIMTVLLDSYIRGPGPCVGPGAQAPLQRLAGLASTVGVMLRCSSCCLLLPWPGHCPLDGCLMFAASVVVGLSSGSSF